MHPWFLCAEKIFGVLLTLLSCLSSHLLKLKVFLGSFSFVKCLPVAGKFFNITLVWFEPEFTTGMT